MMDKIKTNQVILYVIEKTYKQDFNWIMIKPAMLYKVECWPLEKKQETKFNVG